MPDELILTCFRRKFYKHIIQALQLQRLDYAQKTRTKHAQAMPRAAERCMRLRGTEPRNAAL